MKLSAGLVLPASLALIAALAASPASADTGASGSISGTVTSATTQSAVQAVRVTAAGPEAVKGADTLADGTFAITGLPAGDYVVYFEKFGGAFATERYNDAHGNYYGASTPTPVAVADGADTPDIDAALEPGGTITGTIRSGINGQPVSGARACAIEPAGTIQSCASTNGEGTYWLFGLLVGTYRVQFVSPSTDLRDEYYPNTRDLAAATPVSVFESQETTGIDAYLDLAPLPGRGSISGTVTSTATGLPVGNVAVHASSLGTPANGRYAVTRADGTYLVEDLVADEYVVMFDQYLGAYATERYNNAHGWYAVPEPATPVTITEGENKLGIDAALEPGGTITGTVTSGVTGLPIPWPQVCAVDGDGNTLQCAQTNSSAPGFYWLSGVLVGSARVHFMSPSPELRDEYYLNAHALTSATPVEVTQGMQTTGIDAVLDSAGADVTAPEIALSLRTPLPSQYGWNNTDVSVEWSCTDDESTPTEWTVSTMARAEGADQSVTGTCVDDAGNTSEATESGISIDRTLPTVTWTGTIPDGVRFVFGSVPPVPTCTAADTLSGPMDCSVDGYSTAVGTHLLTATARDRALNSATASRSYEVLPWTIRGFRPPVDMQGWNVVRRGSTLPLKFEVFLGRDEATSTSAVAAFGATPIACPYGAAPRPTGDLGTGTLRYDARAGVFRLDWQVPRAPGSCLAVSVTTLDGSHLTARVAVR